MRNCLILGSGRSGTSMVAGTLAKAGYFMGDHLWPVRASNPKGFFEDREINEINETLVAQVIPPRRKLLGRWFFRDRPIQWQRWLARVPVGTKIPSPPEIIERIEKVVRREPYCFKDPRFSYTLPVWRPFLKDTVFLCVFRDPASTARSILKECQDVELLRSLSITFDQALQVWTLMYRHILEIHRYEGEWLFIHFDQVLSPAGLDRIERFVEAPVDWSFPDLALRRSFSNRAVPPKTWQVYEQLCELAGQNT